MSHLSVNARFVRPARLAPIIAAASFMGALAWKASAQSPPTRLGSNDRMRACRRCVSSGVIVGAVISRVREGLLQEGVAQLGQHGALADIAGGAFLRGFVQQLAKYLKLDPTQVSKTYLRRLREWRALTEGETGA